jgi:hypothetical protein
MVSVLFVLSTSRHWRRLALAQAKRERERVSDAVAPRRCQSEDALSLFHGKGLDRLLHPARRLGDERRVPDDLSLVSLNAP